MTKEKNVPEKTDGFFEIGSCVQAIANATGKSHDIVKDALGQRLIAGLIRSKASCQSVVVKDRYGASQEALEHLDCEVPFWFWKFCFEEPGGKQDWLSGVFFAECKIDNQSKDITQFGVELCSPDIAGIPELLKPGSGRLDMSEDRNTRPGGRGKSDAWADWIAELALYVHDTGVPVGSGVSGQDQLIEAIESRLIERGVDTLARTTVQPTVRAVLLRLRSAGN